MRLTRMAVRRLMSGPVPIVSPFFILSETANRQMFKTSPSRYVAIAPAIASCSFNSQVRSFRAQAPQNRERLLQPKPAVSSFGHEWVVCVNLCKCDQA